MGKLIYFLYFSAQWIDSAHMILKGHRSIVNQVRFNPSNYIIASSGVEKLIKVNEVWLLLCQLCSIFLHLSLIMFLYVIQFWSPFPLPESTGSLLYENEPTDKQRKVFTHEDYLSLVLRSGQVIFQTLASAVDY